MHKLHPKSQNNGNTATCSAFFIAAGESMRYSSKLAGICNKQIKILKMLNFATFSSNYRHNNSINKGLPSITRRFFFIYNHRMAV